MLKVIAKKVGVTLEDEVIAAELAHTKETKAKYPKLPALILPGGHTLYDSTVIARHLARNHALYKSENEINMSLTDNWLELLKDEAGCNFYDKVIFPILGHKGYTNRSYNEALAAFKAFLARLNKMGEFLVGSSMTIADIYGASVLFLPFALLIDEGQRKGFAKLAEWFKRITSDPDFVQFFGIPRFCKTVMKPLLPPTEEEEKAEKKAEKAPKKKSEDKAEKPAKEADEDEDEEPKKKEANPLDLLKPSSLNIDDFKRAFFANKTADKKREFIRDTFWKTFDAEGWALWYMDYVKAEGECEVLFKTSNLLGGFLWV